MLSEALDAQETDPTQAIKAYRTVSHQRLGMKLAETISFAERRSGARGKNARKLLNDMDEEVKPIEQCPSEDLTAIEPVVLSREMQAAADVLADAQSALEMVGVAIVS